ncbi:MAG TPA: hypothetical protein VFC17_05265 [Candidatus Limnocylindrales bacterium]|nr:hypothetical protein [Candidatus Limnocylindrales bacterium]
MPNINFECPKCKQTLDAPEELATQLIECPICKETIEVPVRSQRKEAPKPPEPPKPAPVSTPRPTPPTLPPSVPKSPPVLSGITYNQGTVIIGILVLIFFLPFFHATRVLPPPQWEYEIVSIPDYSFNSKMDELGASGWELVFCSESIRWQGVSDV